MQKLGQHFLKNKSVIKKIIAALDFNDQKTIIEIGPGHGELTMALKEASARSGSKIIAIEKDEKLSAKLVKLQEKDGLNIKIVHGDALKVLSAECDALGGAPYYIVGNIPYYITGKLLRTIGDLTKKPSACIFMVQREVAERAVSVAPRMNRLAASIQFWAEPKVIAVVPKADFSPPPKVDSALLLFNVFPKKSLTEESHYYKVLGALFAQPRKTILNNISHASTLSKEIISEKLISCGILPENRPQNVNVQDIMAIAASDISKSLKNPTNS